MSAPTRGTPSRLKSRISGGQSQTGLQMPQPDQSRSLTDMSVELAREEDLSQRPSHPAPTPPASSEFLPSTLGPPLPAHPLPISGPSLPPHFPLPSALGAPHLWPPRTPSFLFLPFDTVPPRPSLGGPPPHPAPSVRPHRPHIRPPRTRAPHPGNPRHLTASLPARVPPTATGLVRSPRAQPGPGAPHSRL